MRFTKIAAACFAMLLVGSLSYGQLGGGKACQNGYMGCVPADNCQPQTANVCVVAQTDRIRVQANVIGHCMMGYGFCNDDPVSACYVWWQIFDPSEGTCTTLCSGSVLTSGCTF